MARIKNLESAKYEPVLNPNQETSLIRRSSASAPASGRRGWGRFRVIIIYKGLSKTAVTRINLSAPWSFIDFLPTTPRAYVYALGIEAASFNPDLYCGLQSLLRDTRGVRGVVGEGRSAFIGNSLERIRKNRDLFEVSLKGKEFKGKFFFCCSIKRARLYCLDLILRRFRFDGEILLLRERYFSNGRNFHIFENFLTIRFIKSIFINSKPSPQLFALILCLCIAQCSLLNVARLPITRFANKDKIVAMSINLSWQS